ARSNGSRRYDGMTAVGGGTAVVEMRVVRGDGAGAALAAAPQPPRAARGLILSLSKDEAGAHRPGVTPSWFDRLTMRANGQPARRAERPAAPAPPPRPSSPASCGRASADGQGVSRAADAARLDPPNKSGEDGGG